MFALKSLSSNGIPVRFREGPPESEEARTATPAAIEFINNDPGEGLASPQQRGFERGRDEFAELRGCPPAPQHQ